jgi:hypothetical protein
LLGHLRLLGLYPLQVIIQTSRFRVWVWPSAWEPSSCVAFWVDHILCLLISIGLCWRASGVVKLASFWGHEKNHGAHHTDTYLELVNLRLFLHC